MEKLLDLVNSPQDLKKMSFKQLNVLSGEIRTFLLDSISKTGGHLASNLGVVELTLALHVCFDTPNDKIVWDVGHQAYVHKILTGRKDQFDNLRQLDGLSGFPKPTESEHDAFAAGHSSTSISAALGLAAARDLAGRDEKVIAVIGDGSMTGGMAYEALNNAGRSNSDLIVILNDNQMSISSNVGAISRHLSDLRTEPAYLGVKAGINKFLSKIPVVGEPMAKGFEKVKKKVKYLFVSGIMFEELGFKYIGPVDGHNIQDMVNVLNKAKNLKGPVLIHVRTIKGKGYKYAEKLPWEYHGVGSFDIKTGRPLSCGVRMSFSSVFGNKLTELAETNKKIIGVSAAMSSGTGLDIFEAKYPKRFFDVGIAEQHAVTFSAGMAVGGFIPVCVVYSTFLQRAYDQIIHDVCMQNLHVVFGIDRAGIVGNDGETHQGLYDIAYLAHMPNMTIFAPKDGEELENLLEFAIGLEGPVSLRYPRGVIPKPSEMLGLPQNFMKSELIHDGKEVAILSVGVMMETATEVYNRLVCDGYAPMLVNVRIVKPIDEDMVRLAAGKCSHIFVIEDHTKIGGFNSLLLECFEEFDISNIKIHGFAFPDKFIEQGSRNQLFERYEMDCVSIYNEIKRRLD